MIFIDTNIVIEYLKNNRFLEGYDFEDLFINDIVVMEFYQGARNKSDLAFIKKEIAAFQILNTHQEIITLAKQIVEKYGLSHNMKIIDALIAATTMVFSPRSAAWFYPSNLLNCLFYFSLLPPLHCLIPPDSNLSSLSPSVFLHKKHA